MVKMKVSEGKGSYFNVSEEIRDKLSINQDDIVLVRNPINHRTIAKKINFKKDIEKGQPWCKIIAHEQPQSDVAVAFFEDENVEPNDFYYIVIKQKGQYLLDDTDSADKTNNYLAFLGPIFIRNVR